MRIHYLQHVPFEGLGSIADWANENMCQVTGTKLYDGEQLLRMDEFDWLVIMGGPMSVYDIDLYEWMLYEKRFIQETLSAGKPMLGICLGAQLIADVMGACVYKNLHKEIGWFPIQVDKTANCKLSGILPSSMEVFHWHGEVFDIPEGALNLAGNEVSPNQGFSYNNRIIGLQFHLETTPESARALIENCAEELVEGRFIQSAEQMLADKNKFETANNQMVQILDFLKTSSA